MSDLHDSSTIHPGDSNECGDVTEKSDECNELDGTVVEKCDDNNEEAVDDESEKQESMSADENHEKDAQGGTDNTDVYSYTKRDDFTSENFKVEISNLPKYVSYVELKKMLKNRFSLQAQKIKLIKGHTNFAFVAFQSEEDRDAAVSKIDGFRYKGNQLFVKKANPAPDPLIKKRRNDFSRDGPQARKKQKQIDKLVLANPSAINDQVAPLWKQSYDEQLEFKQTECNAFMEELFFEIGKIDKHFDRTCPKLFKWWKTLRKTESKICDLKKITPSPVTHGYRNKCEFSIGLDKKVGFRLGLYKDGLVTVMSPPEDCPFLSERMHHVVRLFEKYLKEEDTLPAFNNETHEGYWRQITLRTSENDCVAIVSLHPQKLEKSEVVAIVEKVKDYFDKNDEKKTVTCWYAHSLANRDSAMPKASDLQLISGNGSITETLNNNSIKLQISPFAFFQVNKAGAEVLYKTIINLADINENSVVLDVCCGTGTIGISLAPKVKHVIGIELSEEAIKDCWANAKLNQLTNIEFIQGKAEDVMRKAIDKAKRASPGLTELVCILDPPRAGLNNTIIKILRGTDMIKRIIYVSCEPKMAKRNLLDLCRPTSKAYQGSPFVPVSGAPVDMFPHTAHYELVLLYQRLDEFAVASKKELTLQTNAPEVVPEVDVKDKPQEICEETPTS